MRNQQQVTQRSPVTLSRCVRAAAAGFMFALSLGWSGAMAEQHVKRLVIAMDPANADTNLYWASASDVTTFPALGRLVGNDPKTGKYNDDGLALRWETNEDLSKWTFYLRKNAEWHYGWGKVTAHDVAHSYDLHIVDDATQSGTPQLRGAKVEVIDDYTISFAFKQPRVNFLFVVASRGSMLIYSKAQYEAEGMDGYVKRPAGFERYQIVERRPADRLIFERVKNHWSGRDAPFQEMEFRWATEPATKLALLLSGEAHIANLTRELQPDALARGMKIISSVNPSAQVTVIFNGLYMTSGDPAFNPDLPWYDIRVREAMNRAVNRKELIDVLYDGRAQILVRYGMHPPHEGYVPELVKNFEADYGYDPERARALLAEAGYPKAFKNPKVPIIVSSLAGNPEIGTLAELIQVYFEKVGLQTEMREMDWASMNALGRGRKAYVINPTRNAPIRPTELHLFNSYTNKGSKNHGWEDDKIKKLYDKMRRTLNLKKRDAIAREAFTYLYKQYSDMPIAGLNADVVVNPKVVADWQFPGVTTTGVSHWYLIKPAK